MSTGTDALPLRLDGDNTFPDCECCGRCCHLNVIAITPEELERMHEHIESNGIVPKDRHGECCPLQREDGKCGIWEARPQICKLYNCQIPRKDILKEHPELNIPQNPPLVDLHAEFVLKDPARSIVPVELRG